jgi:hypothetical protein
MMMIKIIQCIIFSFFLCRHRDIHVALTGMNHADRMEAGVEIKWDANRDPGQKFAASVEFLNPDRLNYSGTFLISYPGRTVKGNFHLAFKGTFTVLILRIFLDGVLEKMFCSSRYNFSTSKIPFCSFEIRMS